jgi:hypothetical protein
MDVLCPTIPRRALNASGQNDTMQTVFEARSVMRDTPELSAFAYVTVEKAPVYPAIMHALVDANERFVVNMGQGEPDALGAGGFPSFGPSTHPPVSWGRTLPRRARA